MMDKIIAHTLGTIYLICFFGAILLVGNIVLYGLTGTFR